MHETRVSRGFWAFFTKKTPKPYFYSVFVHMNTKRGQKKSQTFLRFFFSNFFFVLGGKMGFSTKNVGTSSVSLHIYIYIYIYIWVTTQILGIKNAENCCKTREKVPFLAKKFRGNPAEFLFFLLSLKFPLFYGHLDQNVL